MYTHHHWNHISQFDDVKGALNVNERYWYDEAILSMGRRNSLTSEIISNLRSIRKSMERRGVEFRAV